MSRIRSNEGVHETTSAVYWNARSQRYEPERRSKLRPAVCEPMVTFSSDGRFVRAVRTEEAIYLYE